MCLYIVWPVLPAAEQPCIPSQAVMEARCLPVCLRLIINSLTRSSSDFLSLSLSLLFDSLLWEDLWRNGVSVLQTSGSVSRVRLTNWIPHMSFCLEEAEESGRAGGGARCGKAAREGKWSLPVASTSYMTLQTCSSGSQTSTLGFQERWREGDSHEKERRKKKETQICPNK